MNEILQKRIEEAAHQYIQSDAVAPENMQLAFGDFINGAKWALQNQWISVDEGLPERLENENVSDYVFVSNKNWVDVFRYDFKNNNWLDYVNHTHWGITHWMPIPSLEGGEK